MECSICYCDTGSFQKLGCGHDFCAGCIKTWYQKGTGTGCPMCRRPIYFKGFHKVRAQWDADAWELKCSDIFGEAIDTCIADACEMAAYFTKKYRPEIINGAMEDLRDLDKTLRFLKSEYIDAEEIEYIMMETDDYFSDRNINKFYWSDEPVKDLASRYPIVEKSGAKGFTRARARQDPWFEMSVCFLI